MQAIYIIRLLYIQVLLYRRAVELKVVEKGYSRSGRVGGGCGFVCLEIGMPRCGFLYMRFYGYK